MDISESNTVLNSDSTHGNTNLSTRDISRRNVVGWNSIEQIENLDDTPVNFKPKQFATLEKYRNNFTELRKKGFWSKNKNTVVYSRNGINGVIYSQPQVTEGYYLPFRVKKSINTQKYDQSKLPNQSSETNTVPPSSNLLSQTSNINDATSPLLSNNVISETTLPNNVQKNNIPNDNSSSSLPSLQNQIPISGKHIQSTDTDKIPISSNLSNTLNLGQTQQPNDNLPHSSKTAIPSLSTPSLDQIKPQQLTGSNQPPSNLTNSVRPSTVASGSQAPPISHPPSTAQTTNPTSSSLPSNPNQGPIIVSSDAAPSQPVSHPSNSNISPPNQTRNSPTGLQNSTAPPVAPVAPISAKSIPIPKDLNPINPSDSTMVTLTEKLGLVSVSDQLPSKNIPPPTSSNSVDPPMINNSIGLEENSDKSIIDVLGVSEPSLEGIGIQTVDPRSDLPNSSINPQSNSPSVSISTSETLKSVPPVSSALKPIENPSNTQNQSRPNPLILPHGPQRNVRPLPRLPQWTCLVKFDLIFDLITCYDFFRTYQPLIFKKLVPELCQSFWLFSFTFLNPNVSTLQFHIFCNLFSYLYEKDPNVSQLIPLEHVSISNFNLFLRYSIQTFRISLPNDNRITMNTFDYFNTTTEYRIQLLRSTITRLVTSSKFKFPNLNLTDKDFERVKHPNEGLNLLKNFNWSDLLDTYGSSSKTSKDDPLPIQNPTSTSSNQVPITDTNAQNSNSDPQSNSTQVLSNDNAGLDVNTSTNYTPVSKNLTVNINSYTDKQPLNPTKHIIHKFFVNKPIGRMIDIRLISLIKEFQIICLGQDRNKSFYFYFPSIGGIFVKDSICTNRANTWKVIDNLNLLNLLSSSLYSSHHYEEKLISRLNQLSGLFTNTCFENFQNTVKLLGMKYDEAIQALSDAKSIPSFALMNPSQWTMTSEMPILYNHDSKSAVYPTLTKQSMESMQINKIRQIVSTLIKLFNIPSDSSTMSLLTELNQQPLTRPILDICQGLIVGLDKDINETNPISNSNPDQFRFLKNYLFLSQYFKRAYNLLNEKLIKDASFPDNSNNCQLPYDTCLVYVQSILDLVQNIFKKEFKSDPDYRVDSFLSRDQLCPSSPPHSRQGTKCHFHFNVSDDIQFANIKLPTTDAIPRRSVLPKKRTTRGRSSQVGKSIYSQISTSSEEEISLNQSTTTSEIGSTRITRQTRIKEEDLPQSQPASQTNLTQGKIDHFIKRRKIVLESSDMETSPVASSSETTPQSPVTFPIPSKLNAFILDSDDETQQESNQTPIANLNKADDNDSDDPPVDNDKNQSDFSLPNSSVESSSPSLSSLSL